MGTRSLFGCFGCMQPKQQQPALLTLAAIFLAFIVAPTDCAALGVKYKTSGTYSDSAGSQHAWSVNDAHTLIWDGEAYIPVGTSFVPKYATQGDTEENYQADITALGALKSKGITDILLKGAGPITSYDPLAWQRIINYLDTNGFAYGIELDDGPKEPLQGYLIAPNRYRLEGPSGETSISCDWPDVDSAIYIVVNKYDNTIAARGGAVRKDGKLTVNLAEPLDSSEILLIYAHKTFQPVAAGGIGDMWGGFGEYRDRMLRFFKHIKLGSGMRFFMEPFTSKMDFVGDMANFIPDSAGFRVGLEAYLVRKYTHEGGLNSAWGMNEMLENIEVAARVMPFWGSGRGAPYIYDRASAKVYGLDTTASQYWRDIVDYRDISAQGFMNTISDTLRKQVANVPALFKCSHYHRIFANPFGLGGYDGIGAEAYGLGDSPVVKSAGPAYSLAEESGKSTWFITASTQAGADRNSPGYPDEVSMTAALDSLREVGCKGFFLDGLRTGDERQLDWLKSFKEKLKAPAPLDFKPTVISFPVGVQTGAQVKRLMPETWWLPTLRNGRTSDIGEGLAAYTIAGEDRSYLWSIAGNKTITLKPGPTGKPSVEFPSGGGAIDKKKGFTVDLTNSPTVVRGMDFAMLFPCETAQGAIDKLSAAIIDADKAGTNVRKARDAVNNAGNVLTNGQPLIAYGIAHMALRDLTTNLGTDMWIEAEQSPANSFHGAQPMAGASNGLVLVLDSDKDAPLAPYSAAYSFDVPANSSYEIWVAGTPPSECSPMTCAVDDASWSPLAASDGGMEAYARGLAWYRVGTANLFPGKHTLKIKAEGRRQQDNRYYFALDAIVLSPRGFRPNGIAKP